MKRTMLYLPLSAATVGKSPLGPAETISGRLYILVRDQKIVVLEGAGRMIYNFNVTAATKIKIGEKEAAFEDLSALTTKRVTIRFVPMREGNVTKEREIEP